MTAGASRSHTALVTEGSRGIGAAIVRSLAQTGAAVAVNYRERTSEANALVNASGDSGGRTAAIAADVLQSDTVAQMVQRVKSDLGPIEILLDNAGIAITWGIEDLSETHFDRTIALNLKSVFLCAVMAHSTIRAGERRASQQQRIHRRTARHGAPGPSTSDPFYEVYLSDDVAGAVRERTY